MVTCIWNIAAELGEGCLWSPEEGAVWFVDIIGKRIHRYCPADDSRQSWDCPSPPGFILRAAQGWIVGLEHGLYRFEPDAGTFALLVAVEGDRPQNRLNDGTVGPDGAIWFGSKNEPEDEASGAWYRWDGRGEPVRFDDGYVVTNGPAFSPDGRTLYHSDSGNRRVFARDIAADGSLSENRLFVEIAEGDGYPDGLATDADGCLWVALWAGSAVRRYAADGTLLAHLPVPAVNVTKPAFGGTDRQTLYLTTARCGLSADALNKAPETGGPFSIGVSTSGSPIAPFEG